MLSFWYLFCTACWKKAFIDWRRHSKARCKVWLSGCTCVMRRTLMQRTLMQTAGPAMKETGTKDSEMQDLAMRDSAKQDSARQRACWARSSAQKLCNNTPNTLCKRTTCSKLQKNACTINKGFRIYFDNGSVPRFSENNGMVQPTALWFLTSAHWASLRKPRSFVPCTAGDWRDLSYPKTCDLLRSLWNFIQRNWSSNLPIFSHALAYNIVVT